MDDRAEFLTGLIKADEDTLRELFRKVRMEKWITLRAISKRVAVQPSHLSMWEGKRTKLWAQALHRVRIFILEETEGKEKLKESKAEKPTYLIHEMECAGIFAGRDYVIWLEEENARLRDELTLIHTSWPWIKGDLLSSKESQDG